MIYLKRFRLGWFAGKTSLKSGLSYIPRRVNVKEPNTISLRVRYQYFKKNQKIPWAFFQLKVNQTWEGALGVVVVCGGFFEFGGFFWMFFCVAGISGI